MAQSGVGSYSNPLKKFKYVSALDRRTKYANVLRLVFLGEQSGMRRPVPHGTQSMHSILTASSWKDLTNNTIHVRLLRHDLSSHNWH
jgi:hypothetical protein